MARHAKLTMVGAAIGAAIMGFLAGQRFVPPTEDTIVLPAPSDELVPAARTSRADTPEQAEAKAVKIGSLREILQLESDFAQTTALYMLASRRDRKGIEALLEEAAAMTVDSDRNAAASILYSRLAELDPNAAVDRILRSDGLELNHLRIVFHTWARDNLQQALARAEGLQDARNRVLAMHSILLARADLPQAQRDAIAGKYELGLPTGNLGPGPDVKTAASAERSWRETLAMTDSQARSARLSQIAYLWAKRSPEAALQAIEQIDDFELRSQLMHRSMSAWAENSPQQAYEWAQQRRPSAERAQLLSVTLQALLKEQPQMAMGLAEKLTRSEQSVLIPQLLQRWASADLPAATAWLDSTKSPQMRSMALFAIAEVHAAGNPDDALRWAATLPPADAQNIVARIITHLSSKDVVRASSLINTLPEGSSRDSAIYNVAANWGLRDPSAGLAWALRLNSGWARDNAVGAILGSWANYDPGGAVQQVLQMSEAALREKAATWLLANQDMEAALVEQLYTRIENPKVRAGAARRLYYKLRTSDPALAERYRRDSAVPPSSPGLTPMGRQ